MPRFHRVAACLAVIALANCAAANGPSQSSRNLPEITRASPRDASCLAEAVYFEARGTGTTGETAVAHVVVNRAQSGEFPDSVCDVVGDGCQFSYRCDGRPDVLADKNARARALKVAESVLSGAPDITHGALFFHSAQASPGWFSTRPRVGTFGGNVFYR